MDMFLECPDCHRRTVYLHKATGRRNSYPDAVIAVNQTGICYTDHRARKGVPRPSRARKGPAPVPRDDEGLTAAQRERRVVRRSSGVTNSMLGLHRYSGERLAAMTDEDVERCRADLRRLVADRRARGVPFDGIPVADWAHGNGGAYAFEVN